MSKKYILLLFGGNGTEHKISVNSAKFIEANLKKLKKEYTSMELKGDYFTALAKKLFQDRARISFVIPCIHGSPGETGDIQSLLEIANLPFLGCSSQASKICFNKITSKLYFDALGIPNTPFEFIMSPDDHEGIKNAKEMFNECNSVFIKAASQGSSVGCYKVNTKQELEDKVAQAFKYSDSVLVEELVIGRELEIAIFEYNGEVHITPPGEIKPPLGDFYTFDEKYSSSSITETSVLAENIPDTILEQLKEYSEKAFRALGLRHLSRIDFFLTEEGDVYLNEINTFPGMIKISMFPQMLEAYGVNFDKFLADLLP